MIKFETEVQHLKYKVLTEVARLAWEDKLMENLIDIPKRLVPGNQPTMRCCVYKERAILGERVKLAIGGDRSNPNVIEVIDVACDECPVGGYEVTNACRGCLAHRCEKACRFGAIFYDHNHVAHIDKSKCKECGACAKVCPFTAIVSRKRPCQNSCKVKAISVNVDSAAKIDNSKCIQCGACVNQCPFGAIMDKSFMVNAIDVIKKRALTKEEGGGYKVFAIVAPAVSGQFPEAKIGQVVSGIKELGFDEVIEVALGADMVAMKEAKELSEKGSLTSSCCPAFVKFIKTSFPNLAEKISHNLSPMATLAKYLKEIEPNSKIVFIGPCTAKKAEIMQDRVKPLIDVALTFEELQALFDSRDIALDSLEESEFDNATYYGRVFARSGGLTEAVLQAAKEQNLDFEVKPVVCSGIDECRLALLKMSKGMSDGNFIEGMACVGGCVGGAGCVVRSEKNKVEVDKFGKEAADKKMTDVVPE